MGHITDYFSERKTLGKILVGEGWLLPLAATTGRKHHQQRFAVRARQVPRFVTS